MSEDLRSWTPIPEDTFRSDDAIYAPVHWRDPFVFWNEREGCWWMLVAAQKQGRTTRRGCVGLCKSSDLHTWTYHELLYAPMNAQCAFECPDLFRWGDWYYLVYSSYADRFQTLYRMSKSLEGPWLVPEVDTFASRAFYAAKTGSDGSLIVHELHQNADGTLRVAPVPDVCAAFVAPRMADLQPLCGDWKTWEAGCAADAPYSYASMLIGEIGESCRIEMDVTFEEGTAQLGLALRVDEAFAEGYYVIIDPLRARMEYKTSVRMTERGGQMFPYEVEMERPLKAEPGAKRSSGIADRWQCAGGLRRWRRHGNAHV